jgi:hypothetical protein
MGVEICPSCLADDCLVERELGAELWLVMTCRSPELPVRRIDLPVASPRRRVVAGRARPVDVTMTATPDEWARYDEWSRAVAEEFFDGRFAGRPVYLDLEPDIVASLAERAGEPGRDEASLIDAVKATLNLPGAGASLLAGHHERLRRWRHASGDSAPPVLGLLAFFSLVAESMAAEDGLAANNYYGRACELLGLDPHDDDNTRWMFNGFSRHAAAMWNALNGWLESSEGERGLPTAYAYDVKVNVGPAISQALVKEADRRKLPALFHAYGLPAGYSISVRDMERLLEEWLPASHLSNSLKLAFAHHGEARQRIAAVAGLELQAWDGKVDGSGQDGDTGCSPLRLLALIRTFLGARLEFGLAARLGDGRYERDFRATESAPTPRRLSLVTSGDGWVRLADSDAINWPDLLTSAVELDDEEGTRLQRKPTRVIVLRHEPTLSSFVEADRAPLGEDCMVLVRDAVADSAEAMLRAAARPGFTRRADLRGVPSGWELFTDVQILASVEPTSADLQALVPVSWTQLVLADGFSLPGRTRKWHRARPPEVRVSAQSVPEAVVSIAPSRTGPSELEEHELGRTSDAAVFSLEHLGLTVGDYSVILTEKGKKKPISEVTLRLRDGAQPAAETLGRSTCIVRGLPPDDPTHWLTAQSLPLEEAASAAHIEGAFISGATDRPLGEGVPVPDRPAWTAAGPRARARDFDDVVQTERPERPPVESCVITGAHYFVLPAFSGRARGPTVSGRCRDCGLTQWWPSRPPKQGGSSEETPSGHAPVVDLRSVEPIKRQEAIDWELLLDGLAHVRHGSWGQFERMARQGADTALFIHDLGRILESLGHLEIRRDSGTLDPVEWQVPPATIYDTPDGKTLVTGVRSFAFLDALETACSRLGGSSQLHDNGDAGPATLEIVGLTSSAADELPSVLEHALSAPVRYSPSPARRLLAHLPDLWSVIGALPRRPLPQGTHLERFDAVAGRWSACPEAVDAGAYRIQAGRRRYFVRTTSDILAGYARFADPFTIKHATTALEGHPLVAYEVNTSSLLAPLGAELPGLYERAIVLCSGKPPQKLANGLTRYPDVPATHAQVVAARLFAGREAGC